MFLDPPYGTAADRDSHLYVKESLTVAADVLAWCVEHGDDPKMRIALCGYDGEHDSLPDSWECVAWKACGGYGVRTSRGSENAKKERIWFSPHCLRPDEEGRLF